MSATLWLLLAASAASAQPTILYCTGDAWIKIGDPGRHSTVITLDIPRSRVMVETFSGAATGELQSTEQHYTGTLQTAAGRSYWFTVDRFSGEFWLNIPAESRSEFVGKCQPRTQKF